MWESHYCTTLSESCVPIEISFPKYKLNYILNINIMLTTSYKISVQIKNYGKALKTKLNPKQSKIKLLQQEIQTLKNENKELKEENKSHLKILELLSAGHNSDNPLGNHRNYNPAQTLHNKSRPFYLLKPIFMEFSKNLLKATTYRSET